MNSAVKHACCALYWHAQCLQTGILHTDIGRQDSTTPTISHELGEPWLSTIACNCYTI